MRASTNDRHRMAALLGGLALALMPLMAEAAPGMWLNQISELVQYHDELTKGQGRDSAYQPYLGQLIITRAAFDRGDEPGASAAINRFMDMLESRDGGISPEEADAIWSFSYRMTPVGYHDVTRHMRAFGPAYLEQLQRRGEGWIDQLTERVLIVNNIERFGTFKPYLGQLTTIRDRFRARDQQGTSAAMNQLMDMLEAREGFITPRAANALWQYCYTVTPAVFHDVHRHDVKRDLLSSPGDIGR